MPDGHGLDLYDSPEPREHAARPYLCVLFECCKVYARVYRRPERMLYVGRCPRCGRSFRVRVGKDGSDERFLRAY